MKEGGRGREERTRREEREEKIEKRDADRETERRGR